MLNEKYDLRYLPLFNDELTRDVSYIAFKLGNPDAANALLDLVETAILNRLEEGPESYEPVFSRKDRKYPYYRIYVKNYIIYYVVIEENGRKIMEVRRFFHTLEDRDNKI